MLTKKIAKYIQSLNHKKFRDEEKAFIAEGPKLVEEFLASRVFSPHLICARKSWLQENQWAWKHLPAENCIEVDDRSLATISQLKTPNTVLAVFRQRTADTEPDLRGQLSIMLDDLQDPGNLGTIIRIADWFGIEEVICSPNTVDCYNPKVVQSTMGSLARVHISYTDLVGVVENNGKIATYAAVLEGESIYEMAPVKEGILVIGNESKGISPALQQLCTNFITIPRIGHAESLNAAVAAGIIISHMR